MYSGQEIVSQEKCKLILAEFYEGVDCYNVTDKTIKFTLLDWALATYDAQTQTLHTPNFSCRPIIVTDIKRTFEATHAEGVTGLEVVMHTDIYEKIRIMPIKYLPICTTFDLDSFYTAYDFAYVSQFCNTGGDTTIEAQGEVDTYDSTSITLVGTVEDTVYDSSPIILEFLDGSDQLMTITPVFNTEIRPVDTYVYNETLQEYELVQVDKEILLISVAEASSIRFSGSHEYTVPLYDCTMHMGEVYNFCNITEPYETRITSFTDTFEELSDGWFRLTGLSVTEFRILPEHKYLRKELQDYFFSGGEQIEFRLPEKKTFDIFECADDYSWENTFGFIYVSAIYENDTFFLQGYSYGEVVYLNNTATLPDGTVWEFFYDIAGTLDLDFSTIVWLDENTWQVPMTSCQVYYRVDGGSIEPVYSEYPYAADYRKTWSWEKCKFVVTCASVGFFPCTCIECTPEPDGESVLIQSTNSATELCTMLGNVEQDNVVSACDQSFIHGLGIYPDLSRVSGPTPTVPTPTTTTSEYVYIAGTKMYLHIESPSLETYTCYIGDLSYGMEYVDIYDEATDDTKEVNFLVFLYLTVFKIPFEYIKEDGVDDRLWYDDDIWDTFWEKLTCDDTLWDIPCYGWEASGCEVNWPPDNFCDDPDYGKSDEALAMKGITKTAGYDFKIELEQLSSRIPSEWHSGFLWGSACGWLSAEIKRANTHINQIITVDTLDELENITCDEDFKIRYVSSNVPLSYGGGVAFPEAAWGAFQTDYDAYAEAVSLLVTKDAEAFAYFNDAYQQGLDTDGNPLPEEEPPA